MLSYTYHDSPLGPLLLAADGPVLCVLGFPSGSRARHAEDGWREDRAPFDACLQQLDDYFSGKRQVFDLTLRPRGTLFQQSVWSRLQEIPYGKTISYGVLAARVGNPKASRAVGAANGANPIPIIIPCHRVIGADRSLTGFGGGLPLKRLLLNHEMDHAPDDGAQRRLF